jgi:hypothetical protein
VEGGDQRGPAQLGGEIKLALDRLREVIGEGQSSKAATTAMANLAEAIQGLVHHMRSEQQMIRDWVESQSAQQRDLRRLVDALSREDTKV